MVARVGKLVSRRYMPWIRPVLFDTDSASRNLLLEGKYFSGFGPRALLGFAADAAS